MTLQEWYDKYNEYNTFYVQNCFEGDSKKEEYFFKKMEDMNNFLDRVLAEAIKSLDIEDF